MLILNCLWMAQHHETQRLVRMKEKLVLNKIYVNFAEI